MQLSNLPARIAAIFAASAAPGYRNTIPLTQAGIDQPGQASFDVGFPSVTMQPAASGGINPYGQDFNGLGYSLTSVQQWQSAGGTFPYDATFSTAIGGYPKGAVLMNAAGDGFWLSLADSNTSNPDTGGANWAPLDGYGITAIAGLTNANVTLTATQYSKNTIILAGTLTGNVQIIFPTTLQTWTVVNNTTGAFTVTCKTAAGTGAAVAQGSQQVFWGDGTNLNGLSGNSAVPLLVGTASLPSHAVTLLQAQGLASSGSYSANTVVTASTTFTSSSIGAAIEINSATATANILPAASAFASGKAISFNNIGAGIATFTRAGSDTITGGNLAAATAIPLNQGECVTLVSDGTSKWYVVASNVTFFGPPATWQNLTGSRAIGTTYTNSTGRSIDVVVSSSGAALSVVIAGVTVQSPFSAVASFTVPNGATYAVSGGTNTNWAEKRT